MKTLKYREGIFGSLADNNDIARAIALDRFAKHLAQGDGNTGRLRRPGGDKEFGASIPLPDLMASVRELTKEHNHPGYKLAARSDALGALTYGLLLTDPEPVLTDTPGNPYVDLVYTMVFAKFPGASNLGNCYCRHIDGSSSWSQHAFCNAQDFGAPAGANFWATLNAIANYLVANAVQFRVETVIVQDRIWRRGIGWQHYGGAYHYHVHTDGYPNGTGTPECAR